jgi:hypothetical protein
VIADGFPDALLVGTEDSHPVRDHEFVGGRVVADDGFAAIPMVNQAVNVEVEVFSVACSQHKNLVQVEVFAARGIFTRLFDNRALLCLAFSRCEKATCGRPADAKPSRIRGFRLRPALRAFAPTANPCGVRDSRLRLLELAAEDAGCGRRIAAP